MKTKKLTSLDNTKVYVGKYSKEIQEKALKLGYVWYSSGSKVLYEDSPFFFFSKDKEITKSSSIDVYFSSGKTEVTAEEILAMDIPPAAVLKPFDKVLVREGAFVGTWLADIFSHCEDGYFRCVGGTWEMCIPYAGNEHLLGKNED